jgi:hypothetical protein
VLSRLKNALGKDKLESSEYPLRRLIAEKWLRKLARLSIECPFSDIREVCRDFLRAQGTVRFTSGSERRRGGAD